MRPFSAYPLFYIMTRKRVAGAESHDSTESVEDTRGQLTCVLASSDLLLGRSYQDPQQ